MPKSLNRVSITIALMMLLCGAATHAQQAAKEAPGTINGRVTTGEKGVNGISVTLLPGAPGPFIKAIARAATDAEGRYSLTNVPPGRYQILPVAPAFVIANLSGWPSGRSITLAAGETVENMDFTLIRGAVITGRITDADGRPVVSEAVQVTSAEADDPRGRVRNFTMPVETDDRGVYRVYGLPAGRYRVSVGADNQSAYVQRAYYLRTFYPGTNIESEARIIEVAAGGEATDIDITLGKRAKSFKVMGRFVNAEAGQPMADVQVGYGAISKNENQLNSFMMGLTTNARGEFTIEGIVPGRYGVFATSENQSDWYSDVTAFEVTDGDVSGLEVKIRRGASISGTVVVEGLSDRARLARMLSQLSLTAYYTGPSETLGAPYFTPTKVSPDGSFRIGGLRPGHVSINLARWPTPVKGLSMVRVERDGIEVQGGQVEVAEGAQATGLRVVLAYGAGIVRGQVVIKNGDQPGVLPEGVRLMAFTQRAGGGAFHNRGSEVDVRGRFVIEDLPAGNYDIILRPTGPLNLRQTKHPVSVPDAGEVTVTLTLDLSATNDRGEKQ